MYYIGIDLGTSSVKSVLMNEDGIVTGSCTKGYDVSYPKIGWAEQAPEDWWRATKEAVKSLVAAANVDSALIKGIGFSGQMHGLVLLNEKSEVLRPAILWCDQRTQQECDFLNEEIGLEKVSECTGNKALTGFTAPKLLWVRKHEKEVYNRIAHILLPKDYIRYMLTGKFATDASDASGTLLFDVGKRQWSRELLDILQVEEGMLPEVFESWQPTGTLRPEVADELGLSTATVVVGGAGDQAAGAVGSGIVQPGNLSVALGTSGVVFACSDEYGVDSANRLHSFCHANGNWHQMGVMLSAAASLKWWVENVNQHAEVKAYDELLEEAASAPVGANGVVFLPYLMGERTPYSDPNAKGVFFGLNISTTRAEMTRAVLEGVCFGLRDSFEILKSMQVPVESVRISGGGAQSLLWRQILADILGVQVQVINSQDGPAYGAAILAAVGCGAFENVQQACEQLIKVTESTEPVFEHSQSYNEIYKTYQKLYPALQSVF